MKNYTILKTGAPNIFTLEDENGKPVADIRGEALANIFAHLPELLKMLDACVDMDILYSLSAAIELQEKIKPYRR